MLKILIKIFNTMRNKVLIFLILFFVFSYINSEDYKSFITNLNLNLEEVTVVTKDRYINTIWAVSSNDLSKRNGRSIIVQHGLIDGSWSFFILGKDSLAKKLCDEGYRVYLPFVRGTHFSRSHLDYNSSPNSDYWNFSFDQIAEYDLPAVIDYIKERDQVEQVYYIGHSQGNLIYFLAYINNPEFIEKNVKKFVALGTVPNVNNASHFLIKLFQKSKIFNLIPVKNFMVFPKDIGKVFVPFCTSKAKALCVKILSICFGGLHETGRIDYDRLGKTIFLYEPAGTSLQNMKHWIQVYTAKRMQKYDYGSKNENIKHYGTEYPPVYDYSKFHGYSIPSLMTTSDTDPFANPKDTLDFIETIDNKNIVTLLNLTNYNHIDYHWADSAIEEVFPKVLDFLK